MKTTKILCLALALVMLLAGCGKRTVICDGCGKEIRVKESSNVTDEWILYCSDCEKELGQIVPAE